MEINFTAGRKKLRFKDKTVIQNTERFNNLVFLYYGVSDSDFIMTIEKYYLEIEYTEKEYILLKSSSYKIPEG